MKSIHNVTLFMSEMILLSLPSYPINKKTNIVCMFGQLLSSTDGRVVKASD